MRGCRRRGLAEGNFAGGLGLVLAGEAGGRRCVLIAAARVLEPLRGRLLYLSRETLKAFDRGGVGGYTNPSLERIVSC